MNRDPAGTDGPAAPSPPLEPPPVVRPPDAPPVPPPPQAPAVAPPPPPVASASDVLRHVMQLADRYERAWSAALETGEAERLRDELINEWVSYLRRYEEEHTAELAALKERGVETVVERFPLDLDAVGHWIDDVSQVKRVQMLEVASLQSLHWLTEAIQALKKKSAHERKGDELRSWWESGAFSLVVRRADLHGRIEARRRHDVAALLGTATVPDSAMDAVRDLLAVARGLIVQGFADAAVPYVLGAARAVVSGRTGSPPDDHAARISEVVGRVAGQRPLAQGLAILEHEASRTAAGQVADLAVVVPVIQPVFNGVVQLLLAPTEAWQDVLGRQK